MEVLHNLSQRKARNYNAAVRVDSRWSTYDTCGARPVGCDPPKKVPTIGARPSLYFESTKINKGQIAQKGEKLVNTPACGTSHPKHQPVEDSVIPPSTAHSACEPSFGSSAHCTHPQPA